LISLRIASFYQGFEHQKCRAAFDTIPNVFPVGLIAASQHFRELKQSMRFNVMFRCYFHLCVLAT